MKRHILRRIGSALLSAVLALPLLLTSGFTAGGEEEDNPTLSFQNEKYDGIKVFKNIYTNDEYYKDNRQPIRVTNPEPGDIYDINDLGFDEFRLVLYGADNKDDLYKASERPPMNSVKFQRKLGSLLYYNIKLHQDGKDLIVAPYDLSDYFLYYSNADGTINIVFDSRDSYFTHKDETTLTEAQQAEANKYAALTYYDKYKQDGAYYTANGTTEQKAIFTNYTHASPDFYTDSADGSFFIFDGDIVYFDMSVLDKKYVRVKETWESIRDLNAERKSSTNYSNYTGEYIYMIDDDVVTDVIASSQSGSLEVANRFDTPTHELTVSKTVPFFGVAPSDVNPFRTTDIFEYKLLINDKVPASIQYTVLDTKTNSVTPTEDDADEANVVKVGDSYRYVTTDGTFYLYAEESATFYGVKSGDKVEIREYTDPGKYSVLSTLAGNAEFAYVKAADSSETPQRDYASITVQYGDELNQRLNPTFTNVPNVLQVRKRVEETKINTEKEFAFTIQKLKADTTDPGKPMKNEDGEYVIDEDAPSTYTYYVRDGDNNYDLAARTAVDGVFYLKHDQTAMFVGLKENSLYLVTESTDSSYDLRDGNARVLNTRGETVEDSLIRSKSGNYYELYVNERVEMKGIVLTKKVVDSDNRLNPKAEFAFRIEKLNKSTGKYEPVRNQDYSYRNGASELLSGITDENGYFKVRCNVNNFVVKFPKADGTYRITEVDPNDWNDQNNSKGTTAPNPKHEEYLYITDVDYDTYDVQNPEAPELWENNEVQTFNEDMTTHTDDIVIEGISCTQTQAASVEFTNRIREKTYYFDIEKLAYLDDNIHDGKADTTQRFQFKIERFDSKEEALSSTGTALETFYTDLSCTEKFKVIDNGAETNPRYTYTSDGMAYAYHFYPIDYTYTGRSGVTNGDSVKYEDEIVTKTYQKADTKAVYDQGKNETYKFFSTIYRGYRQIAVKKQGYYKITEIVNWSNTDYDYCLQSNRYKGYLDEVNGAKNRLFFDYATTHAEGYDSNNGVLDRSVIIYVGELDDQVNPYTLGAEFFEDATGTVKYVTSSAQDVYVQKRDANGSLLYYVTGTDGNMTTEKYYDRTPVMDGTVQQKDANGNLLYYVSGTTGETTTESYVRREPVIAPMSDFRVPDTVNVGETTKQLYFKEGEGDSAIYIPVYQYALALTDDAFVLETYDTDQQAVDELGNPVVNGENNPVYVTAQRKKEFQVYDSEGKELEGVKKHKLTAEAALVEDNYTHTIASNIWNDTVYTLNKTDNVLRPMASFSNVESEYALLSSNAWADNVIKRASDSTGNS